ncbi:hypothetical protein [Allofournierella sp.]|uniref:hypothetical protein n=1 Tax=Allofournierella sp. TaxID=1940256 RepID=UPI003AB158EA
MEKANLTAGRLVLGLAATLAVLAVLLTAALFFWRPYIVTSGGMRGAYTAGSLLFVRGAQAGELAPGDKVTYRLEDGQVLTARVTEIDPERQQLRVLGDDNTPFDGTVTPYGSGLGRGGGAVPWLGWAAACLHTWPGIAAGAALTAMLALWLALPHWLKKPDEQQDGPGEAEAEERRQAHV